MNIGPVSLIATKSGNHWTLTANYTASFTQEELNLGFVFQDAVRFWEWDDSDHDNLANGAWTSFTPFSLQSSRVWTWSNIPDDALNTEIGEEELRAEIFLRNSTTTGAAINRYSPILTLDPG